MASEYLADVTFVDGANLKFANAERIDIWAKKELKAWEKLFAIDQNTASQIMPDYRAHLLHTTKDYLDKILAAETSQKHHLLVDLSANYITSKSSIGKTIIERASVDIKQAALMYSVISPKLWQLSHLIRQSQGNWKQVQIEQKVVNYIKAMFDVHLAEAGVKGFSSADKSSLEQLRTDVQEFLDEGVQSLEQNKQIQIQQHEDFKLLKGGVEAESKELFRELKSEVESIKSFYEKELGLQMPVTYWREKAAEHRKLLRIWSVFFTGIVILLCVFAPIIFKQTLDVVSHALASLSNPEKVDIAHLAPWLFFVAVSFPLFLSIWLLRLIAKTLVSHQHHMNDASLRVVMTTTFLALMNEKKADEKDRILILNALFHVPSNVNDDGSPPHWFEILQSRLRGGNGGI